MHVKNIGRSRKNRFMKIELTKQEAALLYGFIAVTMHKETPMAHWKLTHKYLMDYLSNYEFDNPDWNAIQSEVSNKLKLVIKN